MSLLLVGWVSSPSLIEPCSLPSHLPFPSIGYSDEKVARLTKEAVTMGFNHFKMKVGSSKESDLRRGKIIRSIKFKLSLSTVC